MARESVSDQMSIDDLEKVMSDTSKGEKISIFNERTIGRMMVDLKQRVARVWLKREQHLGWVQYDLDFLS